MYKMYPCDSIEGRMGIQTDWSIVSKDVDILVGIVKTCIACILYPMLDNAQLPADQPGKDHYSKLHALMPWIQRQLSVQISFVVWICARGWLWVWCTVWLV